MTLIFLKE